MPQTQRCEWLDISLIADGRWRRALRESNCDRREALANIAQHSGARTVTIHLQVTPTHLRLKVTDDGCGIPDDRHERGLRNVRRRAMLLGGSLDLWPNEPSGTIFVWSVPHASAPGAGASGRAKY